MAAVVTTTTEEVALLQHLFDLFIYMYVFFINDRKTFFQKSFEWLDIFSLCFTFPMYKKNTFGMLLQSLWIKAYDMTKCKCNKEMYE